MEIINGEKVATIGDRTRDGLLEITGTSWDSNGTLSVTVRELVGQKWSKRELARARRLARRALMYPEKTRSSRLVRTWWAQGCSHATFAVSRLER